MQNNFFVKSEPLLKFYAFFEKSGTVRLDGLGRSYFNGMNEADLQEAWQFLENDFASSQDAITGLYLMNTDKAVALFKSEINSPMRASPYAATRRQLESNRILMLRYIYKVDPSPIYIEAMTEFSNSEFEEIRGEFAEAVPIAPVLRGTVDALKRMIFTESKCIPMTSAITKLMVFHGLDFDRHDPVYKSIFISLMSDDPDGKIAGIAQLEQRQALNYLD